MAWLSGWDSKNELIEHIAELGFFSKRIAVVDKRVVGNNVWLLMENQEDATRRILLIMLSGQFQNDGWLSGRWGYKAIGEEEDPTQVNCPMTLIRKATAARNDTASEWRKDVEAYHANRKTVGRRTYTEGQIWLFNNKRYRLTHPAGPRKGWIADCLDDGGSYRMPTSYLSRATAVAADDVSADLVRPKIQA